MKTTDELHLLIRGMDRNEKGYFRKFSKLHSSRNGNYLKLFDCVASMKDYSDDQVRVYFKSEKFISRLNATKFYLKNMIVRALRNYYEEQEPYVGKLMALAETYIILKKGLHQTAVKKIMKEWQNCRADENFVFTLQWINLYQRLINSDDRIKELIESAPALYEEKQKITNRYIENAGFEFLRSKIVAAQTRESAKQPELLQQVLRNPLFNENKILLSNIARAQRTELLARVYSLLDEPEKGRRVLINMINWCDDPSNNYMPSPFNYYIMHNQLLNLIDGDEATEMAHLIEKCRKIITIKHNNLSAKEEYEIQANIYLHEMRMYYWLKKPAEMLKSGFKMERYFSKHGTKGEAQMILLLLMAFAYFALKKFDKTLERLNAMFSNEFGDRKDLLTEAYLLNIMVHLELKNYSIIKRQVNLAENFIRKNSSEASTELNLIKVFYKIAKATEARDKSAIGELALKLLKILSPKKLSERRYIADWIQGKLK